MNDLEKNQAEPRHTVCINLGSNLSPRENLRSAMDQLGEWMEIEKTSYVYETLSFGAKGPNFLNMAVRATTSFSATQLKREIFDVIEYRLGRVRVADKNAPRTIDIDLTIFDGAALDAHVWERVYVALPTADLFPNLRNPDNNEPLWLAAMRLDMQSDPPAMRYEDLLA